MCRVFDQAAIKMLGSEKKIAVAKGLMWIRARRATYPAMYV